MKKNNEQSSYSQMHKICIIGIISLIFIYAVTILSKPLITPEIGLYFNITNGAQNISQVLHKFIEFNETWYRPLSLYLTSFLIFKWIDIHNITLIKIVAFGVILFNGFIATELAKKIFNSSSVERIIIFALLITHPVYYNIVFEGSGFSDSIFTIFLNLFLICFLILLENISNKISPTSPNLSGKNKVFLTSLCCLFILCTITAHERGLIIFPMIGILYLFYYWSQIVNRKIFFEKSTISLLIFTSLAFSTYMFFVYGSKSHEWTGEHYRTGIEWEYIIPNSLKAFELPMRMMFYKMNRSYDSHYEFLFNLFAIPLLISLISFFVNIFRSNDTREKNRLTIIIILFFCSLPIAVLFGGSSWHFYTASIYLSIATGRSIFYWLKTLDQNKYLQYFILTIFFILLSISTVRGVQQELPENGNFVKFMSLTNRALNDKIINDIEFIPEVVFYDTGDWKDNTWPFGGQGKLFKYIYKDSKIIEIALVDGKVLDSDQHLCQNIVNKKTLYLGFNTNDLSWHNIAKKNYCEL